MTLKHLKIFVAVCEYGGVTKAAEALYIVQPTVSLAISELEKYYNIKLFDRINQRLVLTEIGQELLLKAKEILAGFEDFESLANYRGKNVKVKIGASLTLGQTIIPNYLKHLKDTSSIIEPHIFIKPTTTIIKELEHGDLDFAIIEGNTNSLYLLSVPIQDDQLVFVSHVDFNIPSVLTLNELIKYPLLLREIGDESRDFLERSLNLSNLHAKPIIESANNQAIITALYASIGVAFLPYSFVKGHIERGKIKEIKIKDFKSISSNYIIIHKNKKLNKIQLEAFNLLKENIKTS